MLPWQQEDQDHTPVLKQWVAIASVDPRPGPKFPTVLAARRLWNDCRMVTIDAGGDPPVADATPTIFRGCPVKW